MCQSFRFKLIFHGIVGDEKALLRRRGDKFVVGRSAVVGEVVAAENGLICRKPLFYHAVLCVRIGGESHVTLAVVFEHARAVYRDKIEYGLCLFEIVPGLVGKISGVVRVEHRLFAV